MAEIIGIVAIKGGVGKTTVTCNLAAALANTFEKRILVVDGNFSAPNLGLHLGIVKPDIALHDVLTNKKNINQAIYDSGFGFHILPGKIRGSGKINMFELKKKLKSVNEHYDHILIDSSPNLNQEMLATMVASDKLFVVTSPDYPTLSCTMHAVRVAKQKKTPIEGLILNRVYNKKFELGVGDIEDAAGCPVLASLPHDTKMLEALSQSVPAQEIAPRNEGIIEYNKLAAAIVGVDYEDPRVLKRIAAKFRKNPSKIDINRAVMKGELVDLQEK